MGSKDLKSLYERKATEFFESSKYYNRGNDWDWSEFEAYDLPSFNFERLNGSSVKNIYGLIENDFSDFLDRVNAFNEFVDESYYNETSNLKKHLFDKGILFEKFEIINDVFFLDNFKKLSIVENIQALNGKLKAANLEIKEKIDPKYKMDGIVNEIIGPAFRNAEISGDELNLLMTQHNYFMIKNSDILGGGNKKSVYFMIREACIDYKINLMNFNYKDSHKEMRDGRVNLNQIIEDYQNIIADEVDRISNMPVFNWFELILNKSSVDISEGLINSSNRIIYYNEKKKKFRLAFNRIFLDFYYSKSGLELTSLKILENYSAFTLNGRVCEIKDERHRNLFLELHRRLVNGDGGINRKNKSDVVFLKKIQLEKVSLNQIFRKERAWSQEISKIVVAGKDSIKLDFSKLQS